LVRRRRQRLGVGQRLVSARLLRRACREAGRRAKSTRPAVVIRPGRTRSAQTCATRRIVPLHRSVLFALHGWHARQRRGQHRTEQRGIRSRDGTTASARAVTEAVPMKQAVALALAVCLTWPPPPIAFAQSAPAAAAIQPGGDPWPRTVTANGAAISIYQPQLN